VRYFLTFGCYGQRLHGEPSGSVDRNHNQPGRPLLESHPDRTSTERHLMKHPPYLLDAPRRGAVLAGLHDCCAAAGWNLLAAHIRSTHVHVVIESDRESEFVMNQLKSRASPSLNLLGFDHPNQKRWARHGSTRWLWQDEDVQSVMRYVIEEQGEPMALFVSQEG